MTDVITLPFVSTAVPGVAHGTSRLLIGDSRERMAELADDSVHCVVTSPPYYGLRDYNTGIWVGGNEACEHQAAQTKGRGVDLTGQGLDGGPTPSHVAGAAHRGGVRGMHCVKCSARLVDRQIGLEGTVREYVDALVEVFREVRRVLRPDGVAWLNLGDSYASRPAGNGDGPRDTSTLTNPDRQTATRVQYTRRRGAPEGLKDKDLIGIPWRVAFALQDDGWWLRNDVIWSKPNPVPESVRDRCTRSHEYVFLLTTSPRYHYDTDAVREPHAAGSVERIEAGFIDRYAQAASGGHRGKWGGEAGEQVNPLGRNRRTVWTITTKPYKGAHFAVFPPDLAEPCILAGTSPLACSECGTAYKRVVRRVKDFDSHSARAGRAVDDITSTGKYAESDRTVNGSRGELRAGPVVRIQTDGFRPGCVCGSPASLKMRPDDMEVIETPIGAGGTEDPTLEVGRGGLARERGDDAGTVTTTRYEQRAYAAQLIALGKHDQRKYDLLREAAGHEAFAHYRRKDPTGARAIPLELLDAWIAEGTLERVSVPVWEPPTPTDCTVLDPFAGSGTVGVVCGWHRRTFIGVELSETHAMLAAARITSEGRPGRPRPRPTVVSDDQLTLGA